MNDTKAFEYWWANRGAGNHGDQLEAWQAALKWRDSQVGEAVPKCAWSDLYNGVVLCSVGSENTFDGRLYRHPPTAQINQQLVEALQDLIDVQNGPPLAKYKQAWEDVMAKAGAALIAAKSATATQMRGDA